MSTDLAWLMGGGTSTKRQDARTRVLTALRSAGTRGLRRDDLEVASNCRSVVQRVQELRQAGHEITSTTDRHTDFSIYVLVREVQVERQSTTTSEVRLRLGTPRDADAVERLRAHLAGVVAAWEAAEDGARVEQADDFDIEDLIGC